MTDRRSRRRQETLHEILETALTLMSRHGVAGLTMTRLARAMAIQPPSLYKYYPSVTAVVDALFRQGQAANLDALQRGMATAAPGIPRLVKGMEATGRWATQNPVLAQLLFWRPFPDYHPSPDAFAPAARIVELLRAELHQAVRLGQVGPQATSQDALALLSAMHFGILSQHLANDSDSSWETGRFTRLHPTIIDLFVRNYPPTPTETPRH